MWGIEQNEVMGGFLVKVTLMEDEGKVVMLPFMLIANWFTTAEVKYKKMDLVVLHFSLYSFTFRWTDNSIVVVSANLSDNVLFFLPRAEKTEVLSEDLLQVL